MESERNCPVCDAPCKAKHLRFNYEVRAAFWSETVSVQISTLFKAGSIEDALAQFSSWRGALLQEWEITSVRQVGYDMTAAAGNRLPEMPIRF